MTEEEAKTKSCCGPMQAEHGKTHVVNCIGSACMAWRWATVFGDGSGYETVSTQSELERLCLPPGPEVAGYFGDQMARDYRRTAVGFCGLAGKP